MTEPAPQWNVARQRLPDRRAHHVIRFCTADGFTHTAGLGYFADGRLAETFLNGNKTGNGVAGGPVGALLDLLASERDEGCR
jgi:YD repeat-containing protein